MSTSKKIQNYMSSFFACTLLRAVYSTMGHNVLDLASLAYQPKSCERSARLTKHVTFALSEQKTAYPAHTRELDENENDKPFVRPGRTTVSEDEDDKPLVQPASREEPERRESAEERRVPAQLRRKKDVQSGEIHLPHWNKMCQETRVSDQKKSRFGATIKTVKLLQNINKVSDVRSLKAPHLKHYHMSSAHSSRREQLTWTFLERFLTSTSMR